MHIQLQTPTCCRKVTWEVVCRGSFTVVPVRNAQQAECLTVWVCCLCKERLTIQKDIMKWLNGSNVLSRRSGKASYINEPVNVICLWCTLAHIPHVHLRSKSIPIRSALTRGDVECICQGGVLEVGDLDEAPCIGTNQQRVVRMEGQCCDAVHRIVFYAINLCRQYCYQYTALFLCCTPVQTVLFSIDSMLIC